MSPRPSLTRLSDLESALEQSGVKAKTHRALLERVRTFLKRYADLERELLGGIQIAVPRHLLDEHETETDRPQDVVERLAFRERKRLDLTGIGERDVMTVLDREELKVYRPPFPSGTDLLGFFVFDENVGPAFVVDGQLPPQRANAVFAQLYGHYLLDHDPYEIRVARPVSDSARSLRARHFAVAFLIDPEELGSYLKGLRWKVGDPITLAFLEHLSVYFEVDTETVVARLLSLGLWTAEDVSQLDLAVPERGPLPEMAVPDRFVRLALEAHARGQLTDQELALHLETDVENALGLAGQFAAPDLDSTSGES